VRIATLPTGLSQLPPGDEHLTVSLTTTPPASRSRKRGRPSCAISNKFQSSSGKKQTRTNTNENAEVSKQAPSVTDKSLHAISESVFKRLDRSLDLTTTESPDNYSDRCCVHRWQMGDNRFQYSCSIVKCSDCRLSPCSGCFKLFRCAAYSVEKKEESTMLSTIQERKKVN
jgi:hypothetical protein